jgi:hypothetical protein
MHTPLPVWVIRVEGSRGRRSTRFRFAPQADVKFEVQRTVAKCAQLRTHVPQQTTQLLDHLVGRREQRRWDGEAENPRRLVVDYQLEL